MCSTTSSSPMTSGGSTISGSPASAQWRQHNQRQPYQCLARSGGNTASSNPVNSGGSTNNNSPVSSGGMHRTFGSSPGNSRDMCSTTSNSPCNSGGMRSTTMTTGLDATQPAAPCQQWGHAQHNRQQTWQHRVDATRPIAFLSAVEAANA